MDARSRHDRTERRVREWEMQLGALTDAYLAWQADDAPPGDTSIPPFSIHAAEMFSECRSETYGLYSHCRIALNMRSFHPARPDELPNVTLVHNGFLGVAPVAPSLAISLRALEAYQQLHRVCPRLSVQAFSRALCILHAVWV